MTTASAGGALSFRKKAATTVAVFVGGPSAAYYMKVVRPRARYEAHLAALHAVPRPRRTTPLFVSGSEPMRCLKTAAENAKVDLSGSTARGVARYVPFPVLVAWRMAVLFAHAVPVALKYLAARYGLFGLVYRDAHESLRTLLTTMGPSFTKLGQWAATRPDVFPEELCGVLSTLFDAAPPHSGEVTMAMLREHGIEAKLRNIDPEPLNSGSIAQVHRAELAEDYVVQRSAVDPGTLAALSDDPSATKALGAHEDVVICKAGTPVVVKVMHPGVREQILADSAALRFIGDAVGWVIPGSQFMSLRQTAEEVCALALSQLNLQREAENLLDFRFNFRPGLYDDCEGKVAFPKPLVAISSQDVLVETYEVGEPLSDKNAKHYAPMGKVAMDMFMRMLFEHNLVHADLHPGNILFRFVNPDGSFALANKRQIGSWPQLVVLDPGLVTSLSDRERKNFVSLFAAVASGDGAFGAQLMYENAPPPKLSVDMDGFKRDMGAIFDTISPQKIGSFSLGDISIGEKLTQVMDVMRHHKVRIDMNFATLVSSVLVGEGMGKRLEPDFNLIEHALPFLLKCLQSHELEFLAAKLQETYLTVGPRDPRCVDSAGTSVPVLFSARLALCRARAIGWGLGPTSQPGVCFLLLVWQVFIINPSQRHMPPSHARCVCAASTSSKHQTVRRDGGAYLIGICHQGRRESGDAIARRVPREHVASES
eukprot:CAMPEP_0174831828 /NCGR_PEP_ID=MMETSP1114-20130205/3330_1 /TAXON_ID=312471 /ORGANISM="Neobodo designis, Strain CCAP 1951/1" /LENGTH=708 /DNA_ID=CAMNT_0016065673 /DNA_START=218 /DNA_END=2345 /DNA_ORIENTATION=+